MNQKGLAGDPRALYMACPPEAAGELARRLPPGSILELCCGVGGLTRFLALSHDVLAVDQDLDRLACNRRNLTRLGLARRVTYVCCDLRRPALLPVAGRKKFVACVLDPDWSPAGNPPQAWADGLADMRPPADALIAWAFSFSCKIVIRLPRNISLMGLSGPLAQELSGEAWQYKFVFLGDWPLCSK